MTENSKKLEDTKKTDLLLPSLKSQTPSATASQNPPVLDKGRVQDTNLTNQDGQPLESETTVELKDNETHERMEERDKIVIDQVSKNPVLVRTRIKEDKLEEYQKLLEMAHKSLDDAQIGDLPVVHPYWGLAERARQFGKANGLI